MFINSNRKTFTLITIAVIVLLVVVIGGTFLWQYVKNQKIQSAFSDLYPLFPSLNWSVPIQKTITPFGNTITGFETNSSTKIGSHPNFLGFYDQKLKELGWVTDNDIYYEANAQTRGYTKGDYHVILTETSYGSFPYGDNFSIFLGTGKIKEPRKLLYYINFNYSKPIVYDIYKGESLSGYISKTLKLKYDVDIFYDGVLKPNISIGSKDKTVFDYDYYIVLRNGENIDVNKIYKDDVAGLSITIQKPDQKLLSYINDPFYCKNDNDCSIRVRDCGYGPYNNFNAYHDVYGCEGLSYVGADPRQCDQSKEHVEAEYSGGLKCQNNQCSAVSKKVFCAEGALP